MRVRHFSRQLRCGQVQRQIGGRLPGTTAILTYNASGPGMGQQALGHNSKAVHRAYAKRALMKIPSLEEYEQRAVETTQ